LTTKIAGAGPTLHVPGTPEYDAARAGFDLTAIPTPELAVIATCEDDVIAAVRYAAERDLPVAVRATGHGPVAGVDGGMLVDTRAMNAVHIGSAGNDARTAVLGAGTTWSAASSTGAVSLTESGFAGIQTASNNTGLNSSNLAATAVSANANITFGSVH